MQGLSLSRLAPSAFAVPGATAPWPFGLVPKRPHDSLPLWRPPTVHVVARCAYWIVLATTPHHPGLPRDSNRKRKYTNKRSPDTQRLPPGRGNTHLPEGTLDVHRLRRILFRNTRISVMISIMFPASQHSETLCQSVSAFIDILLVLLASLGSLDPSPFRTVGTPLIVKSCITRSFSFPSITPTGGTHNPAIIFVLPETF